jgi:anti-sigma factor RsiW
MRDNHIIAKLEEIPISRLSETEMAVIEAHIADCAGCLRAYEAARASDALIRARAAETTEVSPFFKTRVMAAIRERQLSPELPALARMWKEARALVSMMAGLVVVLIGLTLFSYTPDPQPQWPEVVASSNIFSPEYVVLEGGDLDGDPLPYDQVLGTIYDSEDEDGN